MDDLFIRSWDDIIARDSGLFHFRFIVQPLVATFFAVRSGLRDARLGRPAFFWHVVKDPAQRRHLLRELWADVGKLFLVAIGLDVVYQVIVLRWFYPGETLIVATLLAIFPYLVVRGFTNRIVTRMRRPAGRLKGAFPDGPGSGSNDLPQG